MQIVCFSCWHNFNITSYFSQLSFLSCLLGLDSCCRIFTTDHSIPQTGFERSNTLPTWRHTLCSHPRYPWNSTVLWVCCLERFHPYIQWKWWLLQHLISVRENTITVRTQWWFLYQKWFTICVNQKWFTICESKTNTKTTNTGRCFLLFHISRLICNLFNPLEQLNDKTER